MQSNRMLSRQHNAAEMLPRGTYLTVPDLRNDLFAEFAQGVFASLTIGMINEGLANLAALSFGVLDLRIEQAAIDEVCQAFE